MIAPNTLHKPAPPTPVDYAFAPWTGALLCWLVTGAVALVLFPALRGVDPWFGWMPFWLIVAPLIDLVALRHRWITARLRAGVSGLESRRRRARRQARPTQRRVRRPQRHGASTQPTGARPIG
jgi:hypothetical protein